MTSRRWMFLASLLCALAVIPAIWDGRNTIWADSISYLDMATDALQKSPSYLITNPYWSSGYPAVLAAAMAIVHPTRAAEWSTAQVVDWVIFLFTAACFSLLVANLVKWLKLNTWPEMASDARQERAFLLFAYALFTLANLNATVWFIAPDLLLEGALFLGAALSIRVFLPAATSRDWALLGSALAVAYYVKAAAFVSSFALLGILFLFAPKKSGGRRSAIAAVAAFVVVSAPVIVVLSQRAGRLTFGETARLNYAWFVDDVAHFSGWTGQDGSGSPLHPPRVLMEKPLVEEFRAPVSGTNPLWYDPSYWYAGLRIPFSASKQAAALGRSIGEGRGRRVLFGVALIGALLLLLQPRVRRVIRDGRTVAALLVAWPLAVCVTYAMVLVEFRYVFAYLVMATIGAAAVALPALRMRSAILLGFAALLVIGVAGRLGSIGRRAMHPQTALERARDSAKDDVETNRMIAEALGKMGVGAGDSLAQIGHSIDNVYFARLLNARIVAQIWEDPLQARKLSAADVQRVLESLRSIGVKALIDRTGPGFTNDSGWSPIAGTDTSVRLL